MFVEDERRANGVLALDLSSALVEAQASEAKALRAQTEGLFSEWAAARERLRNAIVEREEVGLSLSLSLTHYLTQFRSILLAYSLPAAQTHIVRFFSNPTASGCKSSHPNR